MFFCGHAEDKFTILEEHGFIVFRGTVEAAVKNPDKIVVGYKGRKIAQKAIDEQHILRVIFEDFSDTIKIITFYPGKRDRYENEL